MMKKILFSVIVLFWFNGFGQSSDDCSNGVGAELTVNATCVTQNWNNTSNTDNSWNYNGATCGENPRDDAWGWFDATSNSTTITYDPIQNGNVILTLFEGACNINMTPVACANVNGSQNANNDEVITYNTTIGQRYRVRIQRIAGNNSINGTICVIDTTSSGPNYCTPASSNSGAYIDDFSTTSGSTNITNIGTGYSAGGYQDYTSQVVTQFSGGDISFNSNLIGFLGLGVGIWVDWNNDLDFNDVNEQIYDSAGYINTLNYTYTLTGIPAGSYRMRVLADFWETSPDPCTFDSYGPTGEAEDYSLVVVPLNCADDPINVTASAITQTGASISWTAPAATINGFDYIISTDNTTTTPLTPTPDISGSTNSTTTSINLTGLLTSGTTYYVFVRTDCNGTDQGIWVTTIFNTGCVDTISTPTLCPTSIIDEAGNDPFDPFVANPTLELDCTNGDATLQAHANLKATTSYLVEKITYPSPAPDYDFILPSGSLLAVDDDDEWANMTTPMPFDFSFYNQCYDEFLIGANGMITFDLINNIPGDYCGWQFSNDLPSTDNYLFEQTIYGVYHDIDPRGLTGNPIKTRVVGTAPCRQVQVSWVNIPMFDDASRLYTGMIVLHETTNIIEVFIEEKRLENGDVSPWNDGNAVVGIQGVNVDNNPNNTANEFAVAECRNGLDNNWETFNEAWRFSPDGTDINPANISWYEGSVAPGNFITANSDDTITVNSANTYIAVSDYTLCGNTVTLTDEIIVTDSRKIWEGTINNDWYNPDNWSNNAVPLSTDCVVIRDLNLTNGQSPITRGLPPFPPTTPARAGNLTIQDNGSVEILPDHRLIVTDWITIETDGELLVRDDGNLVQINNVDANNINPNGDDFKMHRQVTGLNSYDYVFWSSPVTNFDVSNISMGTGELIYEWLPTILDMNGDWIYGNWDDASGRIMDIGKGYIIRGLAGFDETNYPSTTQFYGKPNNGAISQLIDRGTMTGADYPGGGGTDATALDDNWNLIGNPYPSAISAAKFIQDNAAIIDTSDPHLDSSIFGTIYLWTHASPPNSTSDPFYDGFVYNYNPNDYIAYNLSGANPNTGFTGFIASGQSFFVQMDDNVTRGSAAAKVDFNNDMRYDATFEAHQNNNFYRTNQTPNRSTDETEKHRIWLDLINPTNTANSILIGYIENATNDFDRLFDGYELSETATRFYSIIEDNDYAIQGKALPFNETDLVPLGLEIPVAGNYSIAINTLDGLFEDTEQNIFLEDTYNNFIHDLRLSPYSFNSDIGVFNDRFILRYTNQALGVDEFESGSALTISAPGNSYINVKANSSPIKSIHIYDVLGRKLYTNNEINELEVRIDNVSQSDGVLFVKAELENGLQKVQKVVLKH